MNKNRFLVYGMGLIIGVLTLSSLFMVNYRYAVQNPGGNDLSSRWVGTRLLITQGLSPYSQETTDLIQMMVYDRLAQPGEDLYYFVYPMYTVYLVAPFALAGDFTLGRALWMTAMEISLVALGFLSLALARWRPSRALLVGYLIFVLLWYHSVRPLINGNPSILVALFIAWGLFAIRSQRDFLAGFLLALATIKPHMVILLIPFTLLWALSLRRWRLIAGFTGSLLALSASAAVFVPDWIPRNLEQILAYPEYTRPGSPGAIFTQWLPEIGPWFGWALTALMLGLLIWCWQHAWGRRFDGYLWAACLTLVITNLVGVRTATANYIALLPGLTLVWAVWERHSDKLGRWLVWGSLLVLFIGLWWLFLGTFNSGGNLEQHKVMFFPLPFFLTIGLISIRVYLFQDSHE